MVQTWGWLWLQWELKSESFLVNVNGGICQNRLELNWNCDEWKMVQTWGWLWLQWELKSESFLVNVNGGICQNRLELNWNCDEWNSESWWCSLDDSDSTHLCSSDPGVNYFYFFMWFACRQAYKYNTIWHNYPYAHMHLVQSLDSRLNVWQSFNYYYYFRMFIFPAG